MMKFSSDHSLINNTDFKSLEKKAKNYLSLLQKIVGEKDYASLESSVSLPFDQALFNQVYGIYNQLKTPSLKYVVDIGIGGSNLGTKAIYDALFGYFDVLKPKRYPKAIFADTNDPEYLSSILALFKEEVKDENQILICLISKSGGTTETIANFELIYAALVKMFPQISRRIVVITDYGSKLWNKALEKELKIFPIPKNVGGRYSVFSAVGLFPLVCLGVNIKSLITGAKKSLERCFNENLVNNPAFLSAAVLFLFSQRGKTINDNFFFHPELESLGKWYRQLMGESIGKQTDIQGNEVYAGITPTVSIGSTDLHSMAQLYLGGPRDKITTFTYAKTMIKNVSLPSKLFLQGLVEDIASQDLSKIMLAIFEGVKIAYIKNSLPFMEIVLDDISEESLGYFMQFKMVEMMFLGKFLNVNAFDQPNVESYKIETKEILSGKKIV